MKELYHCIIGNDKALHRGFGNLPKMCRLVDLRMKKLKVALADVCTLRVIIIIIIIIIIPMTIFIVLSS